MPTPPTFDSLYATFRSEVESRNEDLTDWSDGSNLDAVGGGAAALADEAMRLLIDLFAEQFVDTATGAELDALALDRFGLVRNPASASVVTLTYTRGAATGVVTVPTGNTFRATVAGVSVSFTADTDTDMAAVDSTVQVLATCTATGTAGNVAAGTITTVVDPVTGDAGSTVTNADRATGGSAAESDAAFRDRIRRYFGTLRKGTVAALEAGAIGVPGVTFASVDESNMAPAEGAYVTVYIGDPDARGNDALAALVETELEEVRAAGVDVRVGASVREEIECTFTVYVRAGVDTGALTSAIRAAVLAYTDGLAPGASLYRSQIDRAVTSVSSDILGCSVSKPATEETEATAGNKAVRVLAADLHISFAEA